MNPCGWVIQWGTVPDWLAAIGTVGSFGLVGWGLLREVRLRRVEDSRAAAERRDAEAGSARLVTALAHGVRLNAGRTAIVAIMFSIRNGSTGPIFDVEPGFLIPDESGAHTKELAVTWVRTEHFSRLDAHEEVEFDIHPQAQLLEDPRGVTVITFTDERGLRWRRVDHQQPTRVLG